MALSNGYVALVALIGGATTMVLTLALIFVKRRWLNIALLLAMISLILAAAVLVAVAGI